MGRLRLSTDQVVTRMKDMQYQASPVSSALTARLLAAEPEFVGLERISGAAGDGYLFVFLEIGFQSGGSGGHVKSCAVGVNSQLTDFGELVAAHGNKFGFRRGRMCLLLFGHSAGILKACFRFG